MRRRPGLSLGLVLASLAAVLTTAAGAQAAAPVPSTDPTDTPASPGAGAWRVDDLGDGRWRASWTSPSVLPVGADRPVLRLAGAATSTPAAVAADGRTVSAVVAAPAPPRPDRLDVVLSGDRLDEPGYDPAGDGARTAPPAPRASGPLLDPAPDAVGPHRVVSSDYRLPRLPLTGLRQPVEVVGHVVEPAPEATTGPRPLVVLVPGRHAWCYDPAGADGPPTSAPRWPCVAPQREVPSHLGFDYLQRRLASQGFATVSIAVNGVNAQDSTLVDGGSGARAALVRRHLDHWTTVATAHQVDLQRVVLLGHSRGGEGVDRAAAAVPLDAPYRVAGQVLLAPTDEAAHAAPYVPTVVVLPSCDGDVADLQGQRYVDTSRDVLDDDTALRSSVLVVGAGHNWFNTEWTPGLAAAPAQDDWQGPATEPCGRRHPDRLSAREQRTAALVLVTAAVRLFTGVDERGLALLDGSGARTASLGSTTLLSHALGGGRDVRRPGPEASPVRGRLCAGSVATDEPRACYRLQRPVVAPHWRGEADAWPTRDLVELAWAGPGPVGGVDLDRPLDLTGRRLELRTVVDPVRGPVQVRVRLTDTAGRVLDVDPVGGQRLAPLPQGGPAVLWAEAVRVDPGTAAGFDRSAVSRVELVAVRGDGRVWLADLSAAPGTLAPVTPRLVPRVDLRTVPRRPEGDPAPGTPADRRTAEIPFTLSVASPTPVRLAVAVRPQGIDESRPARTRVVEVPAGRTSGTIPVSWSRDRRDDYLVEDLVSVHPLRGVTTGASSSWFRVVDDDPLPTFRITTPRRVVTEGEDVVFRIVVTGGRDYDLYAVPVPLPTPGGAGRDLDGFDVPERWFRRYAWARDRSEALHVEGTHFGATLRARARVLDFRVPTRVDGETEGVETITVKVLVRARVEVRTVRVRDAR